MFQPFASETPLSLHSAPIHPNMREVSGHIKDVQACLALDEAIGQSSQDYQKWRGCCLRELGFENGLGGAQWDFCII